MVFFLVHISFSLFFPKKYPNTLIAIEKCVDFWEILHLHDFEKRLGI
jgi:hypothetical protein